MRFAIEIGRAGIEAVAVEPLQRYGLQALPPDLSTDHPSKSRAVPRTGPNRYKQRGYTLGLDQCQPSLTRTSHCFAQSSIYGTVQVESHPDS